MQEQYGTITHIQRMSLHDGDGIRTTVFFKGCDFRCSWCHNPEALSPQFEHEWIRRKCVFCGHCVAACSEDALSVSDDRLVRNQARCSKCRRCEHACFTGAIHHVGRKISVDELKNILMEDQDIYRRSGGGVTFSGGEAMLQHLFLRDISKELHEKGVHLILQSNMNSKWEWYERLLPFIDIFYCDLKLIDREKHRFWTGCPNDNVLTNIVNLDRNGVDYLVRTPVIPGVNDREEDLNQVFEFVSKLDRLYRFVLLPFHPLAAGKYKNLGLAYPFEDMPETPKDVFEYWKTKYEIDRRRK